MTKYLKKEEKNNKKEKKEKKVTQLGIHCFSSSSFIRREMSRDIHYLVSPLCYSVCKTSRDACL